ncbi:LOG family protein YvdD [Chryseobacterium piperi]|uniref:Cytokinin riboside 5'-monophosphate phosphoribohydrolase n=1 Tax=Chryseobacterium piperi TaxID=558152 RepID=A0A086B2E0_9FLAO|nr:TIGR00730 family Rossman fold protein [Chryseobacterium piperi]ASW73034.2 TIGR00730 family Rossman fold protein [Chryseobacterium piperi]KFF23104.1 LOG family protein YvdD [Chryseobacterium piperi]
MIKRLTVFCGSSFGTEPIYKDQAYELGKKLAEEQIGLVYGGANSGLMGTVANGVIEHNGEAIGVLPHFLKGREIAHDKLSDLILVDTMHERKTKMNDLSDGVITIPGGYGTLEELFEMMTWAQLGLHQKPIAVLNTNGFYDDLLQMIQTMVDKGFVKEVNQKMLIVDDQIDSLLNKIKNYQAPQIDQWISKDEV